jgi:hypothetical protein
MSWAIADLDLLVVRDVWTLLEGDVITTTQHH